ncbi:5-formyltetrahydrofolate cyclo-ligase [Legionella sp. CNM-4043-24]|uniref:5-formyltetrahydrofolate cyclo-ligase n=1 Tax=Legionella sp. CNM-4043-24 TaxID=3421646 RepID=UPI00403A9CC0
MTDRFKHAIRSTCRRVREQLPLSYQQSVSARICAVIRQLDQYRYARRIALYHAFQGEIDLSELWRSAPGQGKFCYFPVINPDKTLTFLPATPKTPFKNNIYGIPEPEVDRSEAIQPADLDVIFMPLVAFDDRCTRIGMGSGYYDRSLANQEGPLLIGVAYEFQHQSTLIPETWDVPLTAVITQEKIYWRTI